MFLRAAYVSNTMSKCASQAANLTGIQRQVVNSCKNNNAKASLARSLGANANDEDVDMQILWKGAECSLEGDAGYNGGNWDKYICGSKSHCQSSCQTTKDDLGKSLLRILSCKCF